MSSVVQRPEKYARILAVDLRKKGFSYSEIKKSIFVPKSTLSYWLKNLNLSEAQTERLKKKRLEAVKAGAVKKVIKTAQVIEEIKKSSAKDIRNISNRELWLMGIMLYWRERLLNENQSDIYRGVHFTSSDPNLIKFFLKWLKDIGRIKNEEIGLDIFRADYKSTDNKKDGIKNLINYWAGITGFSKDNFSHIYFQKTETIKSIKRINKKKYYQKAQFGLLRIRVKASSMLARQIAGWMRGIQKCIMLN